MAKMAAIAKYVAVAITVLRLSFATLMNCNPPFFYVLIVCLVL